MTFNYAIESGKIKDGFNRFFEIYDKTNLLFNNNKTLYQEKRQFVSRLMKPEFKIVILGIANTGKSTILNTLLETNILSEEDDITTAYPTLIKYVEDKKDEKLKLFFRTKEDLREQQNFLIKEIAQKINESNIAQTLHKANGTEANGTEANGTEANGTEANGTEANGTVKKLSLEQKLRIAYYNKVNPSKFSEIIQQELGTSNSLASEINLIIGKLKLIQESLLKLKENNIEHFAEQEFDLTNRQNFNKENNLNSILYENEEYYIKYNYLKDITIVDLPGLTNNNERHSIATIKYITQNANLILLCLPYGDKINLKKGFTVLESIVRQAPEVLKKSSSCILVKNKIDKVTLPSEKETADKDIKDILSKINIEFIKEYKFSAKNYKTIYNYANGKNDTNLQEILNHYNIKNIEDAKNSLIKHEHLHEFTDFKKDIFNLIENKAKKEFLENSYFNLIHVIQNYYSELNKSIKNIDLNNTESVVNEISFEEFNIVHERLKSLTNEKLATIVREERNITYINQNDIEEIKLNIEKIINQKDKIFDYMTQGLDNNGTLSQAHAFIVNSFLEKNPFRRKIHEKIKKEFYDKYLELFNNELLFTYDIRNYELDIKETIKSIMSINHLDIRIDGTLDVLIPSYIENLNKINYEAKNSLDHHRYIEEIINGYINLLIESLDDFFNKMNKQLHITVKNYLENLKKEFDKIFNSIETRKILRKNIMNTVIKKQKVQEEIEKQNQLRTALEDLNKLEEDLKENYLIK
jgi:predicted GTPase